jgi:hypothetical protein
MEKDSRGGRYRQKTVGLLNCQIYRSGGCVMDGRLGETLNDLGTFSYEH